MVKIILTMIIRREAPIMPRLLASCASIIDAIAICNTEGVKDETTEVVEREGAKIGVPTRVWHETWENFGKNRTSSYLHAQEFIRELNWVAAECYALLLDADMCLIVKPGFRKVSLKEAGYQLIQKNSSIEYWNMRLLRCDVNFHCVGRTHEFWSQIKKDEEDELPMANLTTLMIDDRNDGQFKADKFKRDIAFFKEDLKEDPNNVRSQFYLAQSYKDIGDFERAIKWYKKRVASGGWFEEVWYSLYMIAECYRQLNMPSKMIKYYLEAYDYYPYRAENLHALANYYRLEGKNKLSYFIAKKGLSIPYPQGISLFINKGVYDYLLKNEISIVAYYIPEAKLEGFLYCNELLIRKDVPDWVKEQCSNNMFHYAEALKVTSSQKLDIKLPVLNEKKPSLGTFRPMNPSIIQTKNGYLVNVRCVNYRQKRGIYEYPDGTGHIRTKNIIVKMDRNLNILSESELVDPKPNDCSQTIFGLEDIRLFNWKDSIWFTCSTRITYDTPQITLCSLSSTELSNGTKYTVTSKKLLIGPNGEQSCEKNWMPYVINNHLYLIYSHEPYIRLHYTDKDIKGVEVSQNITSGWDLSRLKGSGCILPFDDGYLGIVHEYTYGAKYRVYLHRFILYDKRLMMKKLSLPFYFFSKDIEYVCSYCFDHAKKHIIMGVGINDYDAYLVKVDVDSIRRLLMDLP